MISLPFAFVRTDLDLRHFHTSVATDGPCYLTVIVIPVLKISETNEVFTVFRKMRRLKQQISEAECIDILKNTKRGVLSLIGDDGYPYGLPINHWYCEEDGKIYFHGAKEGHKIDSIKACSKAGYCVYDEGYRKEGDWALNIKSVIIFGRISLVEDEDKARRICTALTGKFTDDAEYLEKELKNAFSRVRCLEFSPEQMTGKLVNES